METYQILIGAIGLALYWLLIMFITNHKNVLAKPEAEQRKLKRNFYWSLAFIFVFYFGSQLLINSKSTGWIPGLVLCGYLSIWGLGAYLFSRAYRIGIKGKIELIKKSDGQPFNNPQKFARATAITELVTGLSIWALAIAIPLFKIQLAGWAPFIFLVSGVRQVMHRKLEKHDAT